MHKECGTSRGSKPVHIGDLCMGLISHLHHIITRTLAGCIKLLGHPASQKHALTEQDLSSVVQSLPSSPSHDDFLFVAILFTGWYCLLQLGELVQPNNCCLWDFWKAICHSSVKFASSPQPHIAFFLPMHKADQLWEGSSIVLEQWTGPLDPLPVFKNYLSSHDKLFPHLPDLWLTEASKIPTCSWFITRLHTFFPAKNVAGHSLCTSGAMALALASTPLDCIQLIGHWSSEAFLIYLCQNPILLQGSLSGHSAFDHTHA